MKKKLRELPERRGDLRKEKARVQFLLSDRDREMHSDWPFGILLLTGFRSDRKLSPLDQQLSACNTHFIAYTNGTQLQNLAYRCVPIKYASHFKTRYTGVSLKLQNIRGRVTVRLVESHWPKPKHCCSKRKSARNWIIWPKKITVLQWNQRNYAYQLENKNFSYKTVYDQKIKTKIKINNKKKLFKLMITYLVYISHIKIFRIPKIWVEVD